MSSHAKLAPSKAAMWLACPPSAALNAQVPDTVSEYAAEGIEAHELAELVLQLATGRINEVVYSRRVKAFIKKSEYHSQSFEKDVAEYVQQVMEIIGGYDRPTVDLEQRVDLDAWVPEAYGTADVVIFTPKEIHVIDLKFGQGVPVSAVENPQLMLYALGALHKYSLAYEFDTVSMTIIHPRLNELSTYTVSVTELLDWADNTVRPAALLAHEGKGEFNPTEDGCRWCRVKETCRARAGKNLEMAKYDFADPPLLSHTEIAEILGRAGELKKWAGDVEEYALVQARDHGAVFPGWKLVEGRSVRQITDPDMAAVALTGAGYGTDEIFKPQELLGITALEKLMGKKEFVGVLGSLVDKPPGKPCLVPESDSRPEYSSASAASADFAVI